MYLRWIAVLLLCILSETAELQTGKMSRGRKLKVDTGQLKEIFLKYAETCRNKNIKYNDPVFVNISEELKNVMRPMALFLWLKRNYKLVFGMAYVSDIEESPLGQSSSSTPSSHSAASSPTKCQKKQKSTKQFTFLLDVHEWGKVEPISVYYVRRDPRTTSTHKRYKTLPKFKWASLLREKLWEFTRRPCTWVFKNKRIDKDNNVLIEGKCSQCNAITEITSQAASTKTAVMTCTIIDDGNKMLHNPKKKSKLTPYRRHQLAKKLEYKPATVIHKTLGSKMIKDNDDVSPPVLPSVEGLRKIKHEKRQSHRPHSDTILSVLMMSMMSTYQNFIRQVTFVPNLNIYYWSDQQMQYYKTYLEKSPDVTITLDATGSFFQHIKLPNGFILTKRIFLYVAMLTSNSIKSTPIFQMITDSHTTESIHSWLKKWFLEAHIAPQEIITDDSSALIAANVSTFTSLRTVKEYLKRCFLVLTGKSTDLPEVFLRLDSSHFIKNIYNLRCFENVNMNIKMFYIRSILFIKTCESLEIIQNCISNIVKICLCKYDNTKNDACQLSLKYVKSLLFHVEDAVVEKNLTDTFDDYVSVPDDENVLDWFDEIVEKEKILDQIPHESEEPNQYYLPNFVSTLKRLLIKLPLWSNVMCPIYKSQNKSPSSSAVESYFKTLKHLLFQTRSKKYKIDEFLKIHCDFLTGETKIAVNSRKTEVDTSSIRNRRKRKLETKKHFKQSKKIKKDFKQKFSSDSIFADEPSYTENWGGESNASKSKNKPTVLFLKNGNLSDSKCTVTNTCAFDSIFFMMAYGCQVNIYIQKLFNSSELCDLIRDFLNILTQSKNIKTAHKTREQIIMKYYKNENNSYECASNVTYLFEHVLSNYLYSAKRSKQCLTETCESYNTKLERNIVFISINMDIINMFGVSGLEDSIIIDDSELKICGKCTNKSAMYVYEFQNIVSFDLNGTEKILLVDVPQHIQIRRKTYKLIGAIEYIAPCIGDIGHYKTHILINESEMLCYDDNKTALHESSKEHMILHTLTYAAIDS